jgi:hypothetical protein
MKWNEFRDSLIQHRHFCFGRNSGFLAVVRYTMFISKTKGKKWRTVFIVLT